MRPARAARIRYVFNSWKPRFYLGYRPILPEWGVH